MHSRSLVAAALVLLVGLAACGDDASAEPASAPTSVTSTAIGVTPPPADPGGAEPGLVDAAQLVEEWAEANDVIGAVAAVYAADGSADRYTVGWQDREAAVPTVAEDVYRIGSITKLFTAALVLDLVEDGIVVLEDPVAKYIPGAAAGMSIADLLAHTSGLRDIEVAAGIAQVFADGGTVAPPEAALIDSLGGELAFAPGTRQSYSSIGYLALDAVLVAATDQSYETLLTARVLEPLGLSSTQIESVDSKLPTGYERLGPGSPAISLAQVPTTGFARGAGAAGALVATSDDVASFIRALFANELLTAESLELMQAVEPPRTDYGLGLSRYQIGDFVAWGHNGRTIGFASSARHDPVSGVTVVVLSNDGGAPTEVLAARLLELMR